MRLIIKKGALSHSHLTFDEHSGYLPSPWQITSKNIHRLPAKVYITQLIRVNDPKQKQEAVYSLMLWDELGVLARQSEYL
jgi:hypothetical protein